MRYCHDELTLDELLASEEELDLLLEGPLAVLAELLCAEATQRLAIIILAIS